MIAGCGELHVEICLKDLKDAGRGFRIWGSGLGLMGLGDDFNLDAHFFAVHPQSDNTCQGLPSYTLIALRSTPGTVFLAACSAVLMLSENCCWLLL